MRSCFWVTVDVATCIQTVYLYHLSEITLLHEMAQKAGFSRLFGGVEGFLQKAEKGNCKFEA